MPLEVDKFRGLYAESGRWIGSPPVFDETTASVLKPFVDRKAWQVKFIV